MSKLKRILEIIIVLILSLFTLYIAFNCTLKSAIYPLKFKQEVEEFSAKNNLESALIFAVIKVESNFDVHAESSAGALGLMQITKSTADYIASMLGYKDYDIFNPKTNIEFGCYYLKYLILRFKNLETALYAYNAGEGKVANWLNDKEYSDDGVTLLNVPYRETREYTKKIQQTFAKYKKLYRNILDKRQNFE